MIPFEAQLESVSKLKRVSGYKLTNLKKLVFPHAASPTNTIFLFISGTWDLLKREFFF
jgi:hypothetical protein